MGDLIYLDQHRAVRSRPASDSRPVFYFDLGCPFSYLAAERVERTLASVDWVPVPADQLRAPMTESEVEDLRRRAGGRAAALRLPLVWPDRFPASTPCALRAVAHAAEVGAGARFALAASRLAFCGGFDLEDPETLAEAAAASGLPLEDCLAAAGDCERDGALRDTAQRLRDRGVRALPTVEVDGQLLQGESGLVHARERPVRTQAFVRPLRPPGAVRPLAPVG